MLYENLSGLQCLIVRAIVPDPKLPSALDSWERGISDHFGRNCPTVPRVVNLVDFIPHVHNEAESIAAERFRFRWIFDGSDAMATSGFG